MDVESYLTAKGAYFFYSAGTGAWPAAWVCYHEGNGRVERRPGTT